MVIEVFIVGERDAVEQRPHVAEVADRHADLADLAAGQLVVGVVAGLRRQVERPTRQAVCPFSRLAAVERVASCCGGVAGVGPHHPAGRGRAGGLGPTTAPAPSCPERTTGWAASGR
jgi:hypothetical protein